MKSPCKRCRQKNPELCTNYKRCTKYLNFLDETLRDVRLKFDATAKSDAENPCESCEQSNRCLHPCSKYWKWWDVRMTYFRGVFIGEKKEPNEDLRERIT